MKEFVHFRRRLIAATGVIFGAYLDCANCALASTTGGSLPWDAPLQTLAADLTGPVATSISLIALFVAGAILVFGEDLSHFARRALVMVIAIAFLVLGAKFLSALSLTGATV
jgi:type IV secretory pathway VirB2 component (pilin)